MTFRLAAGRPAPVQRSAVSCGAACLVVARMQRDPRYGADHGDGSAPARSTTDDAPQWFATQERATMRRTNRGSLRRHGDLRPPWPTAFGTPPWGAAAELERLTGVRYRLDVVRGSGARVRALAGLVDGETTRDLPVLLYVGSALLPRHVTLLTRDAEGDVVLYDPARGSVTPLSRLRSRFVAGALRVAGWDVPWFLVRPHRSTPRRRRRERKTALNQ